MVTRNVALYTRLSETLQEYVFNAVNADIPAPNKFLDRQELIHSPAASTLLDNSGAFKQALDWTRNALMTAANAYKSEDTKAYAEEYVAHLLDNAAMPQALNITITQAIGIRMRIDTARAKVSTKRTTKKGKK